MFLQTNVFRIPNMGSLSREGLSDDTDNADGGVWMMVIRETLDETRVSTEIQNYTPNCFTIINTI